MVNSMPLDPIVLPNLGMYTANLIVCFNPKSTLIF